jgi:hypothetical protein
VFTLKPHKPHKFLIFHRNVFHAKLHTFHSLNPCLHLGPIPGPKGKHWWTRRETCPRYAPSHLGLHVSFFFVFVSPSRPSRVPLPLLPPSARRHPVASSPLPALAPLVPFPRHRCRFPRRFSAGPARPRPSLCPSCVRSAPWRSAFHPFLAGRHPVVSSPLPFPRHRCRLPRCFPAGPARFLGTSLPPSLASLRHTPLRSS